MSDENLEALEEFIASMMIGRGNSDVRLVMDFRCLICGRMFQLMFEDEYVQVNELLSEIFECEGCRKIVDLIGGSIADVFNLDKINENQTMPEHIITVEDAILASGSKYADEGINLVVFIIKPDNPLYESILNLYKERNIVIPRVDGHVIIELFAADDHFSNLKEDTSGRKYTIKYDLNNKQLIQYTYQIEL
jgi:hypothetical protein